MKFAIKRLQALLLCTVICLLSLAGLLSSCAKNPDPLARDRVSSVLLDSKGRVCVEVTLSARSLEQRKGEGLRLYELLPGETFSALSSKEPLATERIAAEVTFRVPLLEDGHSRLYSSYAVFFDDGSALSTSQAYLQNPEALADTSLPFAWQFSPKALAVDDVEAALSLGVMHDVVEISEAELLPLGADRVPDSVLARLDAEIGASSNAGMQVTLRIRTQTESSLHLSKIDGLADLLADRYADRVSAVWLCGDDAEWFAPSVAAYEARMFDLAFSSRNRDARVYVEAPTQSLLDTKAYFSDVMLSIGSGGSFDWGAALAPSTGADVITPDDLSELSTFLLNVATAGHASRLAVSLPRLDASDEELQAVKIAYAYRLSLAAGATLILYPDHFDDESGICGLVGESRLAATAFSTVDTFLDTEVEQLCRSFIGDAWTNLKTPNQHSRRLLWGVSNVGTDGLSREPIFDFSQGNTQGFVGVGLMEEPVTRESSAWGKQVLLGWIDPASHKTGGVRRVLEDASCLSDASSLTVHLLTQAAGEGNCTAALTLEGVTKEGTRLSYRSDVMVENGEWQSVTFQIGVFTADFDPTKRCTLTLTVTPEFDTEEPYVLWIKGIDTRTPDAAMSQRFPAILIGSVVVLTFALIFAGYALTARKRRR